MIKSESDIFETRFFDTYVSCSLTFVLYTSGNVQLFGLRDSRDSQNHGFGIPGSPWTHGPPRLPISQILGVLGVLESRLPRLPLPSKWGFWESRESGLRDSQYSQNLGYWESRESRESQNMNCKKAKISIFTIFTTQWSFGYIFGNIGIYLQYWDIFR